LAFKKNVTILTEFDKLSKISLRVSFKLLVLNRRTLFAGVRISTIKHVLEMMTYFAKMKSASK